MGINFLTLTKAELRLLIAVFILGVITGSTLLNLAVGPKLDNLIYQRQELKNEVSSQREKLNKLEESLAEEKNDVIKDIKLEIDSELDKHTLQQLEEDLFATVKNMIGKDINKIDPEPLIEALDQKIVSINDEIYQLDLIWFSLKSETVIKFKVDS